MGAKGKKQGIRMPCGWGCGKALTAREMRSHFTVCPKRPGNAAKPGDVILPPLRPPKRARKPKATTSDMVDLQKAVYKRESSKADDGGLLAMLAPVPVAMPQKSAPFFRSQAELQNYLLPRAKWGGRIPKPGERKSR